MICEHAQVNAGVRALADGSRPVLAEEVKRSRSQYSHNKGERAQVGYGWRRYRQDTGSEN